MRAIVRITLAITKQAAPAATAQRCEQIIEADSEDTWALNQIHDRAQALADGHVSNSESLMNSGFRWDHISHSVVFETDHGIG